jgi:hypothetical protein
MHLDGKRGGAGAVKVKKENTGRETCVANRLMRIGTMG